ncbi:MAG: hypothetical protein ACOC9E_01740 [Chloroflexota bacterium]
MLQPERVQIWLFLALTIVLVGFFTVWLPHEAAGLSYIGLEMGEQAKFLPQVRSGEITPGRSLFYVPPVIAGAVLILVTSRWPNRRWQTWAARFVGVGLSFLAFPAIEALGAEAEEWLWRVLMIGAVLALALASPYLRHIDDKGRWLAIGLLALFGAVLPGWVFLEVRSAFSTVYRQQLGIGVGFWLNIVGYLLLVALSLRMLRAPRP